MFIHRRSCIAKGKVSGHKINRSNKITDAGLTSDVWVYSLTCPLPSVNIHYDLGTRKIKKHIGLNQEQTNNMYAEMNKKN